MTENGKGQEICCEVFHPESWNTIQIIDSPSPTIAYAFAAKHDDQRILNAKEEVFTGNILLRSILKLWRQLDIPKQIRKFNCYSCHAEDNALILDWLSKYGCPYSLYTSEETGELHVLEDDMMYFRQRKFISDLYNFELTYKAINNKQPNYSHWPIFFHTDGRRLILRAANLFSVAYVQMVYNMLPGDEKIKICVQCGELFIGQRKSATMCEECRKHRSTFYYQRKREDKVRD